jgi:hypothetical protein
MKKSEIRKEIQGYISVINRFPFGKKGRRKSYLRLRSFGNKKVFFSLFLGKLHTVYKNDRDRVRRLRIIAMRFPEIFRTKKFLVENRKLIYEDSICLIVIKIKSNSLELLSVYPK